MRRGNKRSRVLLISSFGALVLIAALTMQPATFTSSKTSSHAGTPLAAQTTASSTQSPTPSASPLPVPGPSPAVQKIVTVAKPTASAERSSRYGIAAGSGLAAMSEAELDKRMREYTELGVGWIRFDIEWSNIEHDRPGGGHWADYDKVVRAGSRHGLQMLGIIDYTPEWARLDECKATPMCPPADPNAYARFAATVVSRYQASGVKHWEVWNEPNIPQFYASGADPVHYTKLLKAAYSSIKRVDPGATVITAGLSPSGTGGTNMSPIDFVTGMYKAGAKGSFDAVAHHPYTFPQTPADNNPYDAWGQLNAIHQVMAAHGDGNKKIWITEYGAPTGGPGRTATTAMKDFDGFDWHVNEALQAKIVADATIHHRKQAWAGPFFWYSFRDDGTTRDTDEHFFGLTRYDGSHKPAYKIYQQAITAP